MRSPCRIEKIYVVFRFLTFFSIGGSLNLLKISLGLLNDSLLKLVLKYGQNSYIFREIYHLKITTKLAHKTNTEKNV